MGDCLLRKCVVRGEKHGTSMFSRSDHLSYLFTRWLNLVGIYIMYINLEINKQINRTSSVEISSAKSRATNNIAPALYLAIPVRWTPLLYQQGYFKSSTKWGKACFCIDPEHDGAPVAGETLIKNSPPWPNIKSQVRGIQVGTVIAILKTCNICLN